MLDEPLGSLDRALRERLMNELRGILKGVGVTTLYVTHDQAEAFAIADRAVLMNAGRVEQVGSPEGIYCCPATPFVAHFLGLTNIGEGKVIGQGRVASPWGELAAITDNCRPGDRVSVIIRPEAARLSPALSGTKRSPKSARLATDNAAIGRPDFGELSRAVAVGDESLIYGRLVARSFRGGRYRVEIQPVIGPSLTFDLTVVGALPVDLGDTVTMALDPAGVVLSPKGTYGLPA
jgi:ABC-type Fe3+/spermidine/putrescine transport system ATPase subunit